MSQICTLLDNFLWEMSLKGQKTTETHWKTQMSTVFGPHPKTQAVSHHPVVAMDTHIKLHHLPCPAFKNTPLTPSMCFNPAQSNSVHAPSPPPPHTLSLTPAGRLSYSPLSLLTPSAPSSITTDYPSQSPLPAVVPRHCNSIPVGPEPGAWHGPDPIKRRAAS